MLQTSLNPALLGNVQPGKTALFTNNTMRRLARAFPRIVMSVGAKMTMRQIIRAITVLIAFFCVVFFFIQVCKAPGATNAIVLENQQTGTTDWQSTDLDWAIKAPRVARKV